MSNLNIGNVSNVVQSGEIEKLFKGSMEAVSPEGRVGTPDGSGTGNNFSDILRESVDKVNLYQTQADTAVKELVAGRNKNIHETMLTIERADTSLKLMMQVRNKILDAYKEIMRMQV